VGLYTEEGDSYLSDGEPKDGEVLLQEGLYEALAHRTEHRPHQRQQHARVTHQAKRGR
jgi:hypothetical protein